MNERQPATDAPILRVEGVHKAFGTTPAVVDLSFEARAGEILGFLGPNGSGKTTSLRMILDIIRPDSGSIRVFGQPPSFELGSRIGYLPEDRGLYRELPVSESLAYLAALHGVPWDEAQRRSRAVLSDLGLGDSLDKKGSELSRGMHQKAQVVATLLHEPDLLILDEPFQGLDPVNADLLRARVVEQRDRGAAIVLSTHRMEEAESLCDRILLIDHGRSLLYGPIDEVRRQFRAGVVEVEGVELPTRSEELPGVIASERRNGLVRYQLAEGADPSRLLEAIVASRARVERYEIQTPSMQEVFVRSVGGDPSARVGPSEEPS